MPRSRVVYMGYRDKENVHHPCDKVLGYIRTSTGGDSHGQCTECFRLHMGFSGYSPEEIEEMLQAAQ